MIDTYFENSDGSEQVQESAPVAQPVAQGYADSEPSLVE